MIELNIKSLSVNQAWKGRRFKTNLYNKYEKELLIILPTLKSIKAPFKVSIEFYFSNSLSDIDNPLKPFIDVLQKKYNINDRDIFELNVKKFIVKKGKDHINFKIETIK